VSHAVAANTDSVTDRLTSAPIRSISSNGPIAKPPASRSSRSIASGRAMRSASMRSASA
jgi:hypothetical protein